MGKTQNKILEIDVFCENPFFKEDLTDYLKEVAGIVSSAAVTFGVVYGTATYLATRSLVDLTYSLANSFQGGF